jgi:DNA-binding transcriptional MerR regulator/quercetin dioxygenase-like cupin family protein
MSAVSAARAARDGVETRGALLRIGEAARLIGVSTSALRLWERQGLVRPGRSRGGYRLYGAADLDRLRHIRRLRHVDQVNAPGIRRILRRGGEAVRVGASRLRELRRERGLSLRDAADRSGLSVSFLSALERGTTGASIATVQRLTRAYGSTLLDLFGPTTGADRRVVRRRDRPALEVGEGVRIEQLARGAVHLEPQLFVLAPGATSEDAYAHEGEEFLYVLTGSLSLWIGDAEHYRLDVGDAVSFPSSLPHRWLSDTAEETRLLWINTPPTF